MEGSTSLEIGQLQNEFWLGDENIVTISFQDLHPKDSELRINMINSKLVSNYVKYKQFQITTGATNCILLVGGFTATVRMH